MIFRVFFPQHVKPLKGIGKYRFTVNQRIHESLPSVPSYHSPYGGFHHISILSVPPFEFIQAKDFFHGINDLHEEKYLQSRTDEVNRKMNGDTDEDHPAPLIVKTH